MPSITPKGWEDFQHYKDRKPAWIKLHRSILDNYEFHCLPIASKALAPCLWLLASEYDGGEIPLDYGMISFRLRMPEEDIRSAINTLIEKGFFIASEVLAGCKQDAMLEREEETYKTEREEDACAVNPVNQKQQRKPRIKSQVLTLSDWLTACKSSGEKPIPDDDPIREWFAQAEIPEEYQALAWRVFVRDWKTKKPQADWRAVFRNAIRRNWLQLWYFDKHTGECKLTTSGEMEMRANG